MTSTAARTLTDFQSNVLDHVALAARWYPLAKTTATTADDIAYAMSKPSSTVSRALNVLAETGHVVVVDVPGLTVSGFIVADRPSVEQATVEPVATETPAPDAETPEQAVTRRVASYASLLASTAEPTEAGSTFTVETIQSGETIIVREKDVQGIAVGTVTITTTYAEGTGFHLSLVTVPSGQGPHRTTHDTTRLPEAVHVLRSWLDALFGRG